ncbi:hypothetical protein NECAME_05805 [Necator americanus]|uniref:Uncharacterized protein n=1 Tax=Necator americanus TaxID=51031 RepID=W2TY95_NECAM|nr:hypothetical protein NECAME_05805 [Necator americanus]ETN86813.1 hypothetical protein NECAME_05805 [Necator americanus]
MWELLSFFLLLPYHLSAQTEEYVPDDESLFALVSFVPDPSSFPQPPPPPQPRPSPPRPPGPRDGCSAWGDWQQVTCWWPDQPLSSLAPACANAPNRTKWPDYVNKLVQAKSEERYSMIVDEYKKRGEPAKCGFCSRSFECRIRNDTDSRRQCMLKEIREIQRSCDDSKPCEISVENGGCPPPAFLARGRLGQLQSLIREGKFQDFATQFFDINGINVMNTQQRRKGRSYDDSENSIWDNSDSMGPNGENDVDKAAVNMDHSVLLREEVKTDSNLPLQVEEVHLVLKDKVEVEDLVPNPAEEETDPDPEEMNHLVQGVVEVMKKDIVPVVIDQTVESHMKEEDRLKEEDRFDPDPDEEEVAHSDPEGDMVHLDREEEEEMTRSDLEEEEEMVHLVLEKGEEEKMVHSDPEEKDPMVPMVLQDEEQKDLSDQYLVVVKTDLVLAKDGVVACLISSKH